MKAEQSSLYRRLELLHLWCFEALENAPRNPFVHADIRLLAENVMQAQSAVAMALNCDNPKQKFDFLDVVVMSMTNIKSITKVLTQYSSSSERGNHIISKKQRIRLLDIMTHIGNELGSWRNKTAAQIIAMPQNLPND